MATVKKLISLESSLANELENIASILKTSQKDIIEKALDFYFDYTDGIVADNISEQIQNGKMPVYDAEEVNKKFSIVS